MEKNRVMRLLRDIYVKVVMYTNSLYTWWELALVFGIGFAVGVYLAY